MEPPQDDRLRAMMSRIDELLEESHTLKRTRESWSRHVEIQAEIMQLCRRVADLHTRPRPYWMDDDDERAREKAA